MGFIESVKICFISILIFQDEHLDLSFGTLHYFSDIHNYNGFNYWNSTRNKISGLT